MKSLGYYRIVEFCRGVWVQMADHFLRLTEKDSFNHLVEKSKERPLVIFKHSLTCPISARAYDELAEYKGEVALIEIQRARELSREIESRLGVVHESPQVMVVQNGKVVWDASHFDVTADAVAAAVRNAEGQKQ
jgi:monothiol bacilliredoxin